MILTAIPASWLAEETRDYSEPPYLMPQNTRRFLQKSKTRTDLLDNLDLFGAKGPAVFSQDPASQILRDAPLDRYYNIRVPWPGMLAVVNGRPGGMVEVGMIVTQNLETPGARILLHP